jgi:hypothetical protein
VVLLVGGVVLPPPPPHPASIKVRKANRPMQKERRTFEACMIATSQKLFGHMDNSKTVYKTRGDFGFSASRFTANNVAQQRLQIDYRSDAGRGKIKMMKMLVRRFA